MKKVFILTAFIFFTVCSYSRESFVVDNSSKSTFIENSCESSTAAFMETIETSCEGCFSSAADYNTVYHFLLAVCQG